MADRRNEMDMTHGPMAGNIIRFAVPLALSSMLQQLFNMADLAVVGRFASPEAMAAVGSNGSVVGLLVSLFTGLSVGANVVVAGILGSGRREKISDAVHTIVSVALISGVFLLIAGMLIARPILTLMGAPENVIDNAVLYLRIYFCGMPAIMMYNFGSAILRSRGDSRRPFFALTLAGVVNVLLNLLLVIVFRLHVIGVAVATVLSNCLSGGLVMRFLMTEPNEFRLDLKKLRILPEYLKRVVSIGVPAGIQGMVFSLSNVVIQSAVNSFGSNCVAGVTAGANFDFISYCLLQAFAQTCVTFTSQNYGAGDGARCRKAWGLCMGIGLSIDIVLVATMWLLKGTIIQIFTTDPDVIQYAMYRLNNAFVVHFLCGTYEITAGALRGINRSMIPAIISIVGTCAVRLLYVIFIFPRFDTPGALFLVYPITWVITGVSMNVAFLLESQRLRELTPVNA